METMRWLVSLTVSLCALGAQEPSIPSASSNTQTAIHGKAPEVLLDLVVRDKKGRPVSDLKTSDVQILDEGNPMKITGFRLVTGKDAAGLGSDSTGGPKALDPLRRVRLVTLVFEKLDAEESRFARQAALDFIANGLEENVYAAVFIADPRLLVVQQYTTDHQLLSQAVEQATSSDYSQVSARSENIRKQLENAVQPQPRATPGAPSGPSAAPPVGVAGIFARMTLSALQSEDQLVRTKQWRSTVFALLSLMGEQARLPGRKTLLYFAEDLQVPEAMTADFNTAIGAANYAQVSVYGVDTRGLTSQEHSNKKKKIPFRKGAPPPPTPTPAALETLSTGTGGFLIANTKDVRVPLQQVSEDVGAYYELAYVPKDSQYDGRLRKIAVQVDVPDVKVQARNGYLALPPNEGSAFIYELPLLRAMNATPQPNEFPLQAGALRFRPDRGQLEYGLVMEVPYKDISFTEDRNKQSFRAHLSFMVLLKDEHGESVGRFSRDLPIETTADKVEAFRRGTLIQTAHLELAPGQYTLDAAVMDRQNQKISARRTPVVVTAARPGVNVSNLALVRRIDPAAGEADARDPFRFEGGKIIPTLDNSIQASATGE